MIRDSKTNFPLKKHHLLTPKNNRSKNRRALTQIPGELCNFLPTLNRTSFLFIGYQVTEEQLRRIAQPSGVLRSDNDYLDPGFRTLCQNYLPNPHELRNDEWVRAYFKLKTDLKM